MVARPATAPEIAPSAEGLPLCSHSARDQVSAAAAAANRPIAFSTPENSAVRQTKNRYGNMIRVSTTANANLP